MTFIPGRIEKEKGPRTYEDSSNTILRVVVPPQMLRDSDENGRRKSHIEDSVLPLLTLLDLRQMLLQALEGLVLIILAGIVGANVAECVQLLLNLPGGDLNVRPDTPEILRMVHFCAGIANDLDIFW